MYLYNIDKQNKKIHFLFGIKSDFPLKRHTNRHDTGLVNYVAKRDFPVKPSPSFSPTRRPLLTTTSLQLLWAPTCNI